MSDAIWTALIAAAAPTMAIIVGALFAIRAAHAAAKSAHSAANKAEAVRTDLINQNLQITVKLEQVHMLVNSQLDAALLRIRDCQLKLARALAKIDRMEDKFETHGLDPDPDPDPNSKV